MESWLVYTLAAMLTGGVAMVFAKMGMGGTNEHVALVIRTGVLFAMVVANAWYAGGLKTIRAVDNKTLFWFMLAGACTAIYWILYFKAIKTADVSVVATIDKAGILVTVLLSYFLLKEPLTPRLLIGMATILTGTFILIWK
ncbi:EamA family transporter [Pontibacter silvestris]|uniref:EamA family transporter n=1 Tax=Pontibacter silvestris TaxID=2305183 RepID=A0ABW4X3B1_9BACT|nr:EamA family transporter [Pontibacter silvestris]MCC9135781.1 EamA family transporter [Pontibacter silvestris]